MNYLDDQLVLRHIKGTLTASSSSRSYANDCWRGRESKARRGELFKRLAIGYARRDAVGKVVFHSDRRVCEAIRTRRSPSFENCGACVRRFQWFRDHDVELPANPIQGTGAGLERFFSQSLIRDILCGNPFYAAGAYVWARRPVTTLLVDGRLEKRGQSAMRPAEECRVFIRDHHVSYIDWATYEENRRMVRRNSVNREGDESMAAIRAGQGLLVGLLRCGHCGRKLHVRYWGWPRMPNARYPLQRRL